MEYIFFFYTLVVRDYIFFYNDKLFRVVSLSENFHNMAPVHL